MFFCIEIRCPRNVNNYAKSCFASRGTLGLGMCKVCTEEVPGVLAYVPKQSIAYLSTLWCPKVATAPGHEGTWHQKQPCFSSKGRGRLTIPFPSCLGFHSPFSRTCSPAFSSGSGAGSTHCSSPLMLERRTMAACSSSLFSLQQLGLSPSSWVLLTSSSYWSSACCWGCPFSRIPSWLHHFSRRR